MSNDLLCLCLGGFALFLLFMQNMMEIWMYDELRGKLK